MEIEKPEENKTPANQNNNNNNQDQQQKENQDNNKAILKAVNVYMSASMQIITAKMNIIKDLFRTRLQILKTYIPVSSVLKKNPDTGKEEVVQQTQKKQVDIVANV